MSWKIGAVQSTLEAYDMSHPPLDTYDEKGNHYLQSCWTRQQNKYQKVMGDCEEGQSLYILKELDEARDMALSGAFDLWLANA
eukprot:12227568-Ditylum_brightwellii.AAC.1